MRSFGDCVAIITAAVSCFLHQQYSQHQLQFNLRSFAIYKMVYQRESVFFTLKVKKTRINCKIIGTTENAGLENTRSSYRVGVENARLENAGPSYRCVENVRPVAMERRRYECCRTEIDVVVRCRKHTRTGNILYAVINSYRETYTLLTHSELNSLRKIRMHQKSA